MSSANQSDRSFWDQTPILFTQPPRLVLEATSGLTVTIRRPASGAARLRSSSVLPSAAWVVATPGRGAAEIGGQVRARGSRRLFAVQAPGGGGA